MTNHSILYRPSILFVLLTWSFGCDTRTQTEKDEAAKEAAKKVIQQLGVASAPKESPVAPTPTPTLEEVNSDTTIESIDKSIVASDAATTTPASKPAKPAPTEDDLNNPWISKSQLPREIWEVQYVGNTPVGFQRRKTELVSIEKKELIRIEAESRIRVSLQGKPQDQRIIVSTTENDLGELLNIDITLQIGDITNTRNGIVEKNLLSLVVNTNGTETKENIQWQPKKYRGPFAVEQSMMRSPLKKNETRKLKYFDPIQGKVVEGILEADSEYFKTPTLFGGERELLEVRNTGKIGDLRVQALMWVDEQGEGYKSYMQSADIRSFRTEPVEAQKIASLFELRALASKSTPLQGDVTPLIDPKSEAASYTFEAKHDSALYSHFSRRCSQRVVSIDRTTVEITPFSIGPDSKVDDELEESTLDPKTLAASPFVPSTSKAVVDLANAFGKIFPENASAIDKVTICSMGLNKRVAQIEFNGQIATVTDTLKNKRADCVEHALLLASISRAMNIPARVALGAIFNRSQENPEMKFHAWIEIHDGNRWIPFDSTDNKFPVSIDRIKMQDTFFESANPYLEILDACRLISELKIRLLPQ